MKKKSYTGFVLGLLGYVAALLLIVLIPKADEQSFMRLIMLVTVWYMAWLSFHVWRTEQVYWYNGTSYEEAVAAGRERRKEFARKHLVIMGGLALLMTAASCVTMLLNLSAWIDFSLGTVGLIVASIRTVPIKL